MRARIGDHESRAEELTASGLRHRLSECASLIWALVLEYPCAGIPQIFNAKSVDKYGFALVSAWFLSAPIRVICHGGAYPPPTSPARRADHGST